ncbi:flagellar hook protein FlgE [Geodermatophilus sp. SYSU D00703]
MLRSMFSAISGLRAHQTKLDVTGNNIANVNTVGFKGSQTVFQDTLSQVLSNGGAPTAERGGTNPAQVGLGVKVAGVTTNFGQGSTQNTGRATDFLISGDGFFVTKAGNEQTYTRAGSFSFDGSGKLVTPDGSVLQGWMARPDGTVDTNGAIGDLSVPYGQVMPPKATTEGGLRGNLSTTTADGAGLQSQITVYDSLGEARQISLSFTKVAGVDNRWTVAVTDQGGGPLGSATLDFDPDTGQLPTGTSISFTPSGDSWPGAITVDLQGISQFGSASSLVPTDQDGYAPGTLQSFSLSADGTIVGVYSNSLRQSIGQLALATFANPAGLEKAGNSSFRVGNNSGTAVVGRAGAGGAGTLTAGALEMSNVDLAEEFTGLIVAQRGFQANSRVITSSDEVLQDLVNLKR